MNEIEKTNENTELLKDHLDDFIIYSKRFSKWISRNDTGPRASLYFSKMVEKQKIIKNIMSLLVTNAKNNCEFFYRTEFSIEDNGENQD